MKPEPRAAAVPPKTRPAATGGGTGIRGSLAVAWGILAFSFLLGFALVRIGGVVANADPTSWPPLHVAALVASVVGMAWVEGYRGFQQNFSPRFAARAIALRDDPRPMTCLVAPLFCMGLVFATRRRLVAGWMLTLGIVVLVVAVRGLPQPWRAIVDAGVFAGLGWGLAATWVALARALRHGPSVDAELAPAYARTA